MQAEISLRELTPEDGPAMQALSDQSSDGGDISFQNCYLQNAYITQTSLHKDSTGVGAVIPGEEGLAGMGMVQLGVCQFNEEIRPFAYFFSLAVHPQHRRRGIASQIARWRLDFARSRNGPDGVVVAGIQAGNTGSYLTASKWSNQRVDNRSRGGVFPALNKPPKGLPGYELLTAGDEDWEEAAVKQNLFYQDFNFYPPRTPEALKDWHELAPFGFPIRSYWVMRDPQGNMVAGLSITEEGRLLTTNLIRMPATLRLANKLLRFVPEDGVVRRILIKDIWFAPGHDPAGMALLENLRWLLRDRGNSFMTFFDYQSPLARVIHPLRLMPPVIGSLVISTPVPMEVNRPIYMPM